MSPKRPRSDWDRLEALFEAACALPPEERGAFLARECPNDEERAELESLLVRTGPAERLFDHLAASLAKLLSSSEYEQAADEEAMHTPDGDPLLGRNVAHYHIEGRLGVGGMGVVYRARDTRLEREVALKFLPPHLGLDPDAKQRFLLEARAAAALDHPGICTVHEIGETADGRLFIAMARYEGETLKARIARGPVPIGEAVSIAARVARALAAAHARGVVHRDVKPGNVMLTAEGDVKLLDFGLAKVPDVTITRPGVTAGTVAYMSAEQVRGEAVDARSDLWSLGVVLYEMVSGRRPFRGDHDATVAEAIRHEEPESLATLRPETPPWLSATVDRMLAKDPAARYASAGHLLVDLETESASLPRAKRVALLRRRPALAVGAAAGLAVAAFLAVGVPRFSGRSEDLAGSRQPARARTVAVLPFVDISPDPGQEYFSDGLTEELIAALAQVGDLRVVARTSVFAFRGADRDIREIGRALNVGAVVEGSVRKEGNRIRVAAQLIDASDGFHLWADTYDRELTGVFAMQEELALRIAEALRARLTPAERRTLARQPTADLDAYTAYLKGRYFWNQRRGEALVTAISYFERAIQADSGYARAHAGLAAVFAPLGELGYLPPSEGRARMGPAVRRALELDDGLAEAHTALGAYLHVYEWDWTGAERAYRRAIGLDPEYATARLWYGYLLDALGRFEEAITQLTEAVALEPLTPVMSSALGGALRHTGRFDLSLGHAAQALELEPGFWLAHENAAKVHEMKGDLPEAVRAYALAAAHAGPTPRAKAGLARALALSGRADEAHAILEELRAHASEADLYFPEVATAFEALGDTHGAFAWLERSYAQRNVRLQHIAVDPSFSRLRGDPRFQDLLRRIGLRD